MRECEVRKLVSGNEHHSRAHLNGVQLHVHNSLDGLLLGLGLGVHSVQLTIRFGRLEFVSVCNILSFCFSSTENNDSTFLYFSPLRTNCIARWG